MTPGPLIDSRRFEDAAVQRLDNDRCSLQFRRERSGPGRPLARRLQHGVSRPSGL